MPPEPLPWDRKDFFKGKKQERSESLGSVARWKDSHHGSRQFVRWGSDEFGRSTGHGKQGDYQLFSEDFGNGCTPSWSNERMPEVGSFRTASSRGEGKYGRNNKENKISFSQKEWKGPSLQTGNASAISSDRQHDMITQRSFDDLLTCTSPRSDIENTWDQLDKMGNIDGLSTGHRYDRGHSVGSIAWKPLKWTRSSSLSSRGSSFSHSSSLKSIKGDSNELNPELHPGEGSPVQFPSGDAIAGVTSTGPFEETCARKKQRLGWGEGLAKYEKKKVEGPDDKDELVLCPSNTTHSLIPTVADKSPRVTGLSGCASPASPSSVACSSSPGLEDKPFAKASNIDNDTSNLLSGSPDHGFQNFPEGFYVNVEHLELNPISNWSSLLVELLQSNDANSGDSSFVRSTAMNKLLLLKSHTLKALEKTECEIDSFENELKSLKLEAYTSCPCPTASNSLQVDCVSKSCEVETASKVFPRPAPLQFVSSSDMHMEKPLLCNGTLVEVRAEVKDEDIDSPGTATSKFIEPLSLEKVVSPFDMLKHGECSRVDAAMSTASEGKCLVPYVERNTAGVAGFGDENHLIERSSSAHVSSDGSLLIDGENILHDLIFASNKDSASRASEVFNKLLPNECSGIDIWGATGFSCRQDDSIIKEKLAKKKCNLRFKERVLTLKFRAFQHLWKEDLRLLSIRKYRAKSQKRFELSSRTSHTGYLKHRASIRSRFTSPAGTLTMVPTTEIVDFTTKLLSDSQIKLYRNTLRMPALILGKKEQQQSRFVTSNGLVEDPCAVEKERVTINPWTSKEKEIFLEMLATFGKDFKKIASFLDHKTTADCIEFYYKNHKSESFEKIKKKMELRKQGRNLPTNTYMTTGKKWNREVNAASLDMLGAASVIAAHADSNMKTHQTCGGMSILGGHYDYKTSRGDDGVLERSSGFDILVNEREAAAANVLAGICGALSSEAVSSCVTSCVDPGEGCQEWKCQKVTSVTGGPSTPEVMQNFDDEETCSDDSCGELDSVEWTDEEKSGFIQALRSYGKDFAKISQCVRTRSRDQCKIFFSKARKCLGLDVIHSAAGNETPESDANGGRSDTEDACVVEMDSAICSTQSCSEMTHLDRLREKSETRRLDNEDAEPAVKTVVPDDCLPEVKPALIFDGDNTFVSGVDGKFGVTPEVLPANVALSCDDLVQRSAVLSAHIEAAKDPVTDLKVTFAEESISSGGGLVGLGQSRSKAAVEHKAVPEPKGHQLFLPQNGLDDKQDAERGADTSSQNVSCSYLQDSDTDRNSSHQAADTSVRPGFSLTPNYQHQISLELLPSKQKPQTNSWKQENCPPVPASSVLQGSSTIQYEDHPRKATFSSILNFEEHGNKQHQKSVSADIYHQNVVGHHPLNHAESLQILRGYPVRLLNQKEMEDTDSIGREKPVVVQSFPKICRNSQSNQCLVQDLYHVKRSNSKPPHSVAELPLLSKCREQQSSSDHPRLHSRSSSDTEEPSRRTRDVKLFGQILSNPSPLPKPGPSTRENDDQRTSPKLNSESNLKCTGDHGTNGAVVPSKIDPSNYSGPEEFPVRSYGFWDGNKIQTGLSSLPDSAFLLAKYPAAFGGYTTSSCRVEQQPQPTVVKRNDRNLGGEAVFPAKDLSVNGGLPDYQVYGSKVPPFTLDRKRHETFSELQKRNGFETVSGFQQKGRGTIAGRGILVGGGCTSVSDPVTAMKMHFATTERHGGQTGSIREEEESWRGKGEMNSR
ncbi:hypothetical protein HHK36_016575 [Tetracentron sinense]|uniref:SANT domain-containing protein n=1 Tax=Tetracentron sinense TaxID=13715 RepID=A0A834YZS6_TETSI|nr:hypothetical protein HHK36_016575 [Tetracentron sinense]